jgi:hypothetical protein
VALNGFKKKLRNTLELELAYLLPIRIGNKEWDEFKIHSNWDLDAQ